MVQFALNAKRTGNASFMDVAGFYSGTPRSQGSMAFGGPSGIFSLGENFTVSVAIGGWFHSRWRSGLRRIEWLRLLWN